MERRFFCLRGFMKSGTNWVGSLLSSHASICCIGEFHWEELMAKFNQNQRDNPLFANQPELTAAARNHVEEMIRQTMIAAAEPTATMIGDRTPHTILPVTLRNVPHITVVRDGRDVLVSRLFHLYNQPAVTSIFDRIPEMKANLIEFEKDPWYFQKHPEKLLGQEEIVKMSATWWKEHLESDLRTIEAFPKLPVLIVRYEDIHADVQGERAKMFEFLGMDPTRAAKLEGVLKPGFKKERPDEFLRKGIVGDWKNYFTDQAKAWFNESAGEMLVQQGYADSRHW